MADTPQPPDSSAGEITLLLQRASAGDGEAADRILPLVYDELRKIAASKMSNERAGHTLQATALVHEAWLRLGGDEQPAWQNRAHFFSAAAEAMRRILVENARRKGAQRHGGGQQKLSASITGFDLAAPAPASELLLLNDALDALATHDARKAELVKQWYFVGLTLQQIATILGINERTAQRDLAYAKTWLFAEMQRQRG